MRERERGAVDNPDRSNVFVWLSARIYDGHSLVEASVGLVKTAKPT